MLSDEIQKICNNCGKDIPESKLYLHEPYCLRNVKRCQICNEAINIEEEEEHIQEFHTDLACQHCKGKFPKLELHEHQEGCVERLSECKFCHLQISVKDKSDHESHCGAKTEYCWDCKKYIPIKDYEEHVERADCYPDEPYLNQHLNVDQIPKVMKKKKQQAGRIAESIKLGLISNNKSPQIANKDEKLNEKLSEKVEEKRDLHNDLAKKIESLSKGIQNNRPAQSKPDPNFPNPYAMNKNSEIKGNVIKSTNAIRVEIPEHLKSKNQPASNSNNIKVQENIIKKSNQPISSNNKVDVKISSNKPENKTNKTSSSNNLPIQNTKEPVQDNKIKLDNKIKIEVNNKNEGKQSSNKKMPLQEIDKYTQNQNNLQDHLIIKPVNIINQTNQVSQLNQKINPINSTNQVKKMPYTKHVNENNFNIGNKIEIKTNTNEPQIQINPNQIKFDNFSSNKINTNNTNINKKPESKSVNIIDSNKENVKLSKEAQGKGQKNEIKKEEQDPKYKKTIKKDKG
jgi:hypothetical protein